MKKVMNLKAVNSYSEMFAEDGSLNNTHPGLKKMQELSVLTDGAEPTAVAKLEVYKECHRLADDLYRVTGSKRIFAHVLRIGNLLLSRIFNEPSQKMQLTQ